MELLAPGSTTAIDDVDFPPLMVSLAAIHDPYAAEVFPSSKPLISAFSDPAGGGGGAGRPLSPWAPVTVSFTVLVLSELGPTIRSKTPGSTTRCISMFRIESMSGVILNSTVLFSPGFRVMRSNPFNCITGCVTDETRGCT